MNPQPQNVLDYHGNNTIFLVWNFKPGAEIKTAFKRICALVINFNNSADVRFPDSGVSCVMGIGHDAWFRLGLPSPLPRELENFIPVVGEKYTAVATKGDLHFHLRGNDKSICFDMAEEIANILNPVATNAEEVHGFSIGMAVLSWVLWMAQKIRMAKKGHTLD